MTSRRPQTRAESLLAACSTGDVKLIDSLLSSYGISAPHSVIPFRYGRNVSELGPDEPPSTQDMFLAAVKGACAVPRSASSLEPSPSPTVRTLSSLLRTFPSTPIRVCHLEPLVDRGDVAALDLLLSHQSTAVNDEVSPGGVGLLGGSIHSSDDAALCLLKHGADPNGQDWFRKSCLQVALERETANGKPSPSSSVVKELLARGAKVDAESINAAKKLQENFMIALLNSHPDSSAVQKGLAMASPDNVNPEACRILQDFRPSRRL